MATFTRQPFGDITASRMQALGSSKNRQNALSNASSAPSYACPLKPNATPGKRQREPEIFDDDDDDDCENTDPVAFSSPTKKSRTASHVSVKPARFSMVAAPPARSSVSLTASPAPSVASVRKSLSSPNTARSTPISHSRGSPKNKRLSAVSKRRASTSPFRRVDPPSFTQSAALPFSIDAALSGTLSTYTPKPTSTSTRTPTSATPAPATAPAPQASSLDDSMPKAWFFEIHEDTPEQEAANLMEHSTSILDISTDHDACTKARLDDLALGKENVPPPDFALAQPRSTSTSTSTVTDDDDGEETEIETELKAPVKRPRIRNRPQDAMDEDRRPLGDLPPTDFYADGCTAASYVTVEASLERPSKLSRELEVDGEEAEVEAEAEVRDAGKRGESALGSRTEEVEVEADADEETDAASQARAQPQPQPQPQPNDSAPTLSAQ